MTEWRNLKGERVEDPAITREKKVQLKEDRKYFAGMALQGLLSSADKLPINSESNIDIAGTVNIARQLAAEMIKQGESDE